MASVTTAQILVKERVYPREEYEDDDCYDMETCQIVGLKFGCASCGGHEECRSRGANPYWFQQECDEHYHLPHVAGLDGYTAIYCDSIAQGYTVVYQRENDASTENNDYQLLLFNPRKHEVGRFNLCTLTSNVFGRIEELLTYNGKLYFNYVSRRSSYGSDAINLYSIYCFDLQQARLSWHSDYITNRSEFVAMDDYIVTGYGYVDINTGRKVEEGRIMLLDIKTGMTLTDMPIYSTPYLIDYTTYDVRTMKPLERLSGTEQASAQKEDKIFVCEQSKTTVYRFSIQPEGVRVKGDGVRLRRGPSTSDAIYADANGKAIRPTNEDCLRYLGETDDWYKVSFNDEELYISKQFSELEKPDLVEAAMCADWTKRYPDNSIVFIAQTAVDTDDVMECLIYDNDGNFSVYAVGNEAGQADAEAVQFVCRHGEYDMRYYPADGYIRAYMGLSNGYEEEHIYHISGSRLQAHYLRLFEPQGNIHQQSEVDVRATYSKIMPDGTTTSITEAAFEAAKAPIKGQEGEKMEFDI